MPDDNVIPFTPRRPVEQDGLVFGGPVEDCWASLTVYGDDLDPDDITRRLGVAPDNSHRRGERIRERPPARTGYWGLQVKMQPGDEPDGVFARLLDRLPSDPSMWKDLHARYRLRVFVMISFTDFNKGFGLSAKTIRRLARRGLTVDFDLYADDKAPDLPL
jgi:hypothetical protein